MNKRSQKRPAISYFRGHFLPQPLLPASPQSALSHPAHRLEVGLFMTWLLIDIMTRPLPRIIFLSEEKGIVFAFV